MCLQKCAFPFSAKYGQNIMQSVGFDQMTNISKYKKDKLIYLNSKKYVY